jgi:hypothetical protein
MNVNNYKAAVRLDLPFGAQNRWAMSLAVVYNQKTDLLLSMPINQM